MKPYYERSGIQIFLGDALDCLREMDAESVHCVVTSPPYWGLRDYCVEGQIGMEHTPQEFVAKMVEVFREVRRVLRNDGTCWVNLGDSYAGGARPDSPMRPGAGRADGKVDDRAQRNRNGNCCPNGLKPKDLCGIPWRVAFALQEDGWYLRQDIIWAKPNPMPESVTDRCTKSHEYLFLLSKSAKYYFNQDAIKEVSVYQSGEGGHQSFGKPGGKAEKSYGSMVSGNKWDSDGTRNKRSVWEIATQPYSEAHFATYPEKLVEPCILAGCPAGGVVLDPFAGSMTTLAVAQRLQCKAVGIELNPEYIEIGLKRLSQEVFNFDNNTTPDENGERGGSFLHGGVGGGACGGAGGYGGTGATGGAGGGGGDSSHSQDTQIRRPHEYDHSL